MLIALEMWLSLLTLLSLFKIAFQTDISTFCDKEKTTADLCVVSGYVCPENASFEFDFKDINGSSYAIKFDNAIVENCTSFKIGPPPKELTSFSVSLNESKIFAANISIDVMPTLPTPKSSKTSHNLGDSEPSFESYKLSLLNSQINASKTKGENEGTVLSGQRPYFTGSCPSQGQLSTNDRSNIKSYGRELVDPNELIKGDSKIIQNKLNFGSGFCSKHSDGSCLFNGSHFMGGGRIYLHAGAMSLTDSFVLSNAEQNMTAQSNAHNKVLASGTGGVVFLAAYHLTLDNNKYPNQSMIQCRGGNYDPSTVEGADIPDGSLVGGGGRVFVHYVTTNNLNFDDWKNSIAVDSLDSKSNYSQTGTVQISDNSTINLYVTRRTPSDYDWQCFTLLQTETLRQSNISQKVNLIVSGSLKAALYNKDDKVKSGEKKGLKEKPNFEISFSTILVRNKSILQLVSQDLLLKRMLTITTGQFVLNSSILNPIGAIKVVTDTFSVVQSSRITFFLTHLVNLDPNSLTDKLPITLQVEAKNIFVRDSFVQGEEKLGTKSWDSFLALEAYDNFELINSELKMNKILINTTNLSQDPVIKSSKIRGLKFNCQTESMLKEETPTKPSLNTVCRDQFENSNKQYDLKHLLMNQTQGLASYDSVALFFCKTLKVENTTISRLGYVGMVVDNQLQLQTKSEVDVSAFGCSPQVHNISSTKSKYMKICSVVGGSNAGKGFLGTHRSFDNCKYVLSGKSKVSSLKKLISGEGGQKNHQIESKQSGYGGGIINLMAKEVLSIETNLLATGGDRSKEDYTTIAGGAGGSIQLVSKKINLTGTYAISAAGGKADTEVV